MRWSRLGVRRGRNIGNIILHGAVAVAAMGVGSIVRAQLRRLGALGYLQAPHRAAPPSHRAATSRSGWRAQARNGAAAVSMRGSAPVPLQPRPAMLRRYCRARQPAPALRTPSSDARSRARSVLSRRSGSRDLATASAGTTHRCVHVFVASLPTRLQWLAWAVLKARQHCARLAPALALRVTRAHRAYNATCMDARGDGAGATYRNRLQLQCSQCSRGPRALQRVPFLLMPCMELCKHLLRKASRLNSTRS